MSRDNCVVFYFWGKLLGNSHKYLPPIGRRKNEPSNKTTQLSLDTHYDRLHYYDIGLRVDKMMLLLEQADGDKKEDGFEMQLNDF